MTINRDLADLAQSLAGGIDIADGGTGATTASAARTALGLGSMATQANTAVNIDGGTIDGASIGANSPASQIQVTGTVPNSFVNTGANVCLGAQNNGNSVVFAVSTQDASTYATDMMYLNAYRSASASYDFLQTYTGNGTDVEHRITGDGNGLCDGSWTGGGADYAEFFETLSGAAIPLGTTLVLDGAKIRPWEVGDDLADIIGVVRPKKNAQGAAIIGNAAWSKWKDKYLTDDFGQYIMESHVGYKWMQPQPDKVVNGVSVPQPDLPMSVESHNIPEGVTVPENAEVVTHDAAGNPLEHRKLNPAYDPDAPYVPREDRDEWVLVGLVGQVRILAGQPVNPRWAKMRDISASVEEWFIR